MKLEVAPGPSHQVIEVPLLVASAAPASMLPAAPMSSPASKGAKGPPPADRPPESDGATQRVIGFVTGGVGIGALVVGIVFGAAAIRDESRADDLCDPKTTAADPDGTLLCSNGEAISASEDAKLNGTLSTAFVFSGIGLVAAGLLVVLTAPDVGEATASLLPILGPEAGGAVLRVRF